MEFSDVIKNRHSVRNFLAKEVEQEKLYKILETANRAPSAGNLQAYEIVVVKDQSRKQLLADVALGQDFIVQAPVVLVFFANPEVSSEKYEDRGENLYCIQDATIAAAHSQLAVTDLGLSSCWVGAFDDESVKKVLNAPKHLRPVCILPIGYAAENPTETYRRKLNDLVHREGF